jgi:hypothetical protein
MEAVPAKLAAEVDGTGAEHAAATKRPTGKNDNTLREDFVDRRVTVISL